MKLTISKSKNSKTYYYAESYRNEQGKSTTRTLGKLGSYEELRVKLGPDVDIDEWARAEVRRMTAEQKAGKPQTVMVELQANTPYGEDERRLLNVWYLFLQQELYSLGFKTLAAAITEKHGLRYDFEKIMADLVYSQVLDAESGGPALECCKGSLFEMPDYEAQDIRDAIKVIVQESGLIVDTFCKNAKKLGVAIPKNGRKDMTPSEIIANMRSRAELAKYCGTLKPEYKSDKDNIDEETGFTAQGVVCFVALLVLTQLERKVNAFMPKAVKTEKLTETLNKINVMPLGKVGYRGIFVRTDLTDALHQLIDVRFDCMLITAGKVEKAVKESKILAR